MSLNSGNKTVSRNWYFVIIPYMVISCINTLVRNQPKLIRFTYRHGRTITYVETPVVGANSYEGEV